LLEQLKLFFLFFQALMDLGGQFQAGIACFGIQRA
jgi:hypothetical protein